MNVDQLYERFIEALERKRKTCEDIALLKKLIFNLSELNKYTCTFDDD
jgi:hypothetical protein